MLQNRTQQTRRGVLVAGVAGVVALSGCTGFGLRSGFEFPDGEPSADQKEIVQTFVEQVHDGRYEVATQPFTSEMIDSLDPEKLERTWSQNVGQLGRYKTVSQWGVTESENTDAVFGRVECKRGYYVLQVTLREDQIAGLFFKDIGKK